MNTPIPKTSFFSELQRRHVYKVGAAYAVAGWLLAQVITQVLPVFNVSLLVQRVLVLMLIAGFPVALMLAWLFDVTPEGIVRTGALPAHAETPQAERARVGMDRKLNWVLGALLVLALGYFAAEHTLLSSASTVSAASRDQASVGDKSIAVLPFENLSEDKANAYFAIGIQDEILTRLAKIGQLKVISRTSTEKYRAAPDNLREIAHQLGVAYILEGSVQKPGDTVRVNVQLINALSDAHVWADTYDRTLSDVFSVESDIATRIADTLQARLSGDEQRAVERRPTADPEAYQLYLKGRYFWNKRTSPDIRRAIDYFEQAIAKDKRYAEAYAALAQAWDILPAYGGGTPKECFPQAQRAANQALALDDRNADALAERASLMGLMNYDFAAAAREYEKAVALDPNNATIHHWFANQVLDALGQYTREIAEMRRALELDPLSLIVNANLGFALLHASRYDEAIAQFRRTLELDASFYYARSGLGQALELKGLKDEAVVEYNKVVGVTDDPLPLAYLGHVYGTLGRTAEARRILDQLRQRREQSGSQGYVDPYAPALVALGLGDRSEALHWLEQGYAENNGFQLGPIRGDRFLWPLHGDPRFETLAEKIVPAHDFGEETKT